MSKNENSKKTAWEKLKVEAGQETTENESAIKEETATAKTTSSPNKLTHPSYESLEEQLSKTEAQLEAHKSQLIQYKEQDTYRLAEMENIRRRSKLDIENAYKFSLEKIIKDLLPVKDSLEAALLVPTTEAKNDAMLKGVQLTLQTLEKVLKNNGVEAIEPATGETFNPEHHQAMLMEESADQTPNTIVKILQKGYLLNNRLMRPALVVVAKVVEKNA